MHHTKTSSGEYSHFSTTVGLHDVTFNGLYLIHVIDAWNSALDQGYEVRAIFFDVRKAIDTVPHLPLAQSMDYWLSS